MLRILLTIGFLGLVAAGSPAANARPESPAQGAGTLNARTAFESTSTLPNHTSMVTGRRIDERRGGHGVDFNHDRPVRVRDAAGEPVKSILTQVARLGGSSVVFATKTKFSPCPSRDLAVA